MTPGLVGGLLSRGPAEQTVTALDTAHEFRVPDPAPVQRERSRIVEQATDG